MENVTMRNEPNSEKKIKFILQIHDHVGTTQYLLTIYSFISSDHLMKLNSLIYGLFQRQLSRDKEASLGYKLQLRHIHFRNYCN